MAEKRMISKVISISKKFNVRLDDHFSRLLFVLLIPHSDDFGRLTGDPFKIKALILPMMDDAKWEDVEQSLAKLHQAELIIWYEVKGEKYIQINNFEEHQTGLHKRTRSKFPEPPGISRKLPEIPPEEKRREENGTEENGREGSPPATISGNLHEQRLMQLMIDCQLEEMDMYPVEQVLSYVGMVDIEVIEFAIKKGSRKHINYTLRTLEGLVREGKTSKDSVRYIQAVPDKKKDAELEARDIEIARNQWINAGGDPNEFRYKPASGG